MSNQAPGVTVGNAGKIAADLVVASVQTGRDINEVIGLWASTADTIVGVLNEASTDTPAAPPQAPAGGVPGVPPAVANHFPGTTVQQQPQQAPQAPQPQVNPGGQQIVPPPGQQPGNVVPFPGAGGGPAPSAGGPAPVPGTQQQGQPDPELEEAWQVFFQDVQNNTFAQNWEDNRNLRAQGGKYAKVPHFKHKTWKRPGAQYPVGLYLGDKKAPEWVKGALESIGIGWSA